MYLLDTHAILWFLMGHESLSNKARIMMESDSKCFYSIISLWEIAIKQSVGKLDCTTTPSIIAQTCKSAGFLELPLTVTHIDS